MDITINSVNNNNIILINFIKILIEKICLLQNSFVYLDNISTINYIFGNNLNNIKLYFYTEYVDFYSICKSLKQININENFGIKFGIMETNYYVINSNLHLNKNRNYDHINILYNNVSIIIYFFNNKLFYTDDKFNNFIKNNFFYKQINELNNLIKYNNHDKIKYDKIQNCLNKFSNIHYLINNNNFYLFDKNYGKEIKINTIFEITNNFIDFDFNLILQYPFIFFNIFGYYLITRLEQFESNIKLFINNYHESKKFKKQIKFIFEFQNTNYLTIITKFINLIIDFNLENIFLKLIESYPIITKIIFGLDKLEYVYRNFEDLTYYLMVVMFNKYKILNKNFKNYLKSNYDTTDFDFILNNRLKLLRNLKKNNFNNNDLIILSNIPKIIDYCEILYILFYCPENDLTININSLKLVYIIKKFYYFDENDFNYVFDFYNEILSLLEFNETFYINKINNSYLFKLIEFRKCLFDIESELFTKISVINKDYINKIDSINIYDYQDSFYLVLELIYLNKLDLNDIDYFKLSIDEYMDSVIANIRADKLIKYYDLDNNIEILLKKYQVANNTNYCNNLNLCNENDDENIQTYLNEFAYSFVNFDTNIDENDNYDNDNYDNDSQLENLNEYINDLSYSMDNIEELLNFDYEEDDNTSTSDNLPFVIDNNNIINNFINDSNKNMKYQKYKNKYIELKKIYKIISNDYFDINLFKSEHFDNKFVKLILNTYDFSNSNINLEIIEQDNYNNSKFIQDTFIINEIIDEIIDKINICF